MLIQDLVPGADYNIVAEHALPIVLTKGTARVLSPSEPEETRNTHRSRASGTKVPVGSILVRFCWPSRRGVRTRGVRGNGMCREEEGTTEGGIQAMSIKKNTAKTDEGLSLRTNGVGSDICSGRSFHGVLLGLAIAPVQEAAVCQWVERMP